MDIRPRPSLAYPVLERRHQVFREDHWPRLQNDGGFQGNNNTTLARAMREWLAFRDSEEAAKREKEADARALDVRRARMHEVEAQRLGLTDVCVYKTEVEADEDMDTSTPKSPIVRNGDHLNPITLEDEPHSSHADVSTPAGNDDATPTAPEQPTKMTTVIELLRKRQREDREDADLRREGSVLMHKRLKMMEEQVLLVTKLVVPTPQPDSPSLSAEGGAHSVEVAPHARDNRQVIDIALSPPANSESGLASHCSHDATEGGETTAVNSMRNDTVAEAASEIDNGSQGADGDVSEVAEHEEASAPDDHMADGSHNETNRETGKEARRTSGSAPDATGGEQSTAPDAPMGSDSDINTATPIGAEARQENGSTPGAAGRESADPTRRDSNAGDGDESGSTSDTGRLAPSSTPDVLMGEDSGTEMRSTLPA